MKKIFVTFCLSFLIIGVMRSQPCVGNCSLYTVASIPYSVAPAGGTSLFLGDDQLSGACPIGFTFSFMCSAYTQMYVSSNGFISFNPACSQGCCSGGFCPTAGGNPNNYVAFAWTDLYPPGNGQLTYQTLGTAPNRVCVITYTNIPFCCNNSPAVSGQIRLYETTNIIEIHSAVVNCCNTKTQGIMNQAGTSGFPTPGRNSINFTVVTPDGYRFTPQVGGPTAPSSITGSTSVCPGYSGIYSVPVMAGATSYNWVLPPGWLGTSSTNTINVTPTSSGVMSITVTYTCGTSTVTTLSVSVNPTPTITVTGGSAAICPSTQITLTGNGASSYVWNPGGPGTSINVSPTVTTDYTVTGTSAAGCTATTIKQVTVLPGPTVAISGNASTCQGGTVFLTASGATTYSWSNGAGGPNIAVSPPTNTVYTCIGTLGTCTGQAMVTVTVNPLPSINIVGSNTSCAGSLITLVASGANTYTWSNMTTNQTLTDTPMTNTVYSVVGTNTVTGCSNSGTFGITVSAVPNVTVTGPTAMCINQTITLTGWGANSYSWSNGATTQSIVVSPTSNVSYTVIGTSTLGCSSQPVVKNITVNNLPLIGVTPTGSTICRGQSILLTANGGNTYSWSPGGALTPTINPTPTVTTVYNVVGTNTTTGCYANASVTITVQLCTSIESNVVSLSDLILAPNPNNGQFVVELNNGMEKQVSVFDLMGRSILQINSDNDKIFVDITNYASGVYYVKVQTENSHKVLKVIKE